VAALRATSAAVATAVAQAARADGVARNSLAADVAGQILDLMWQPAYRPVRPA
jgi:malate dehydrogenase (oxaloacetate-decarboxylating)